MFLECLCTFSLLVFHGKILDLQNLLHGHTLSYITPFKIFGLPPPLKIVIFWLNIFPLNFWFQVVLMLNQLWLYRFIPHSFLMTMQGWWRIFLSFRISEFKYLRKKLSRPLLLISTFITVRRKYHKLFHSPSLYPIERV